MSHEFIRIKQKTIISICEDAGIEMFPSAKFWLDFIRLTAGNKQVNLKLLVEQGFLPTNEELVWERDQSFWHALLETDQQEGMGALLASGVFPAENELDELVNNAPLWFLVFEKLSSESLTILLQKRRPSVASLNSIASFSRYEQVPLAYIMLAKFDKFISDEQILADFGQTAMNTVPIRDSEEQYSLWAILIKKRRKVAISLLEQGSVTPTSRALLTGGDSCAWNILCRSLPCSRAHIVDKDDIQLVSLLVSSAGLPSSYQFYLYNPPNAIAPLTHVLKYYVFMLQASRGRYFYYYSHELKSLSTLTALLNDSASEGLLLYALTSQTGRRYNEWWGYLSQKTHSIPKNEYTPFYEEPFGRIAWFSKNQVAAYVDPARQPSACFLPSVASYSHALLIASAVTGEMTAIADSTVQSEKLKDTNESLLTAFATIMLLSCENNSAKSAVFLQDERVLSLIMQFILPKKAQDLFNYSLQRRVNQNPEQMTVLDEYRVFSWMHWVMVSIESYCDRPRKFFRRTTMHHDRAGSFREALQHSAHATQFFQLVIQQFLLVSGHQLRLRPALQIHRTEIGKESKEGGYSFRDILGSAVVLMPMAAVQKVETNPNNPIVVNRLSASTSS